MIKPQIQWVFLHHQNPQDSQSPKNKKTSQLVSRDFTKITLQKPTPPIAAAVFSGLAAEELPGTDDLEEVNESNGSELFLHARSGRRWVAEATDGLERRRNL